ncbi:MAG: hypothetical protein V3U25_04410, partial [Nitrososphaerales archaeon]
SHVTGQRTVVIHVDTKSNEEKWSYLQQTIIPSGGLDLDSHVIMRKYDKLPPDVIIVVDLD